MKAAGDVNAGEAAFRRTVWCVAAGILALATAQAVAAKAIGSQLLFADALDWGYAIALNGIAAFVHGRGERAERVSALVIAAIFVFGGFHTLHSLWDRIVRPEPTEPQAAWFLAASASLVAVATAAALARFRRSANPLTAATWLGARNDLAATALAGGVALALDPRHAAVAEYGMDAAMAALLFQAAYATTRASLRAAEAGPA